MYPDYSTDCNKLNCYSRCYERCVEVIMTALNMNQLLHSLALFWPTYRYISIYSIVMGDITALELVTNDLHFTFIYS